MLLKDRAVLLLATACFIGTVPFAPGSLGTLAGLPICYILSTVDIRIAVAGIVGFVLLAVIIAQKAEKILQKKDPKAVVIDEMAGVMVAIAGLPFRPTVVILGYLLFRLFDILKPFPIRQVERKLPGGWGIVMDDVAAGLFSNIILRTLLHVFNLW